MSIAEQPDSKRKRAESPDHSSAVVEVARSDIWYDDGNVILQAQGTQFRVHKSLLAQSSSVFNDMFSFPQPPATDAGLVEGCPVVHLSDSAAEVRYILQAIFQREHTAGENMPLPVLSAFLRLGSKYDIQKLNIQARKKLFQNFPSTLAADDALDTHFHGIEKPTEEPYVELLLIARSAGLLSILPRVLYECCETCPASQIRKDGFNINGSTVQLSLSEQVTLLAGQIAMRDALAATTYQWFDQDVATASCATPGPCQTIRKNTYLEILTSTSAGGLDDWSWPETMLIGEFCQHCAAVAPTKHAAGRERFWEQLPDFFDLPSWDELLKEREGILEI
ncbi:hypothetical protein FIBSPDRAFT_1050937 [Athelia psychrophila]|uniref:BTB domain-containing protein n=1 Tax=Athelia psychrophila TaxID=1759441 RepID=A0A166A0C3_9AGAM|nr:hypothetical protein FIBSPDRAFT_1050937 [Fibularhizoctonia sp. CBS 109695]